MRCCAEDKNNFYRRQGAKPCRYIQLQSGISSVYRCRVKSQRTTVYSYMLRKYVGTSPSKSIRWIKGWEILRENVATHSAILRLSHLAMYYEERYTTANYPCLTMHSSKCFFLAYPIGRNIFVCSCHLDPRACLWATYRMSLRQHSSLNRGWLWIDLSRALPLRV